MGSKVINVVMPTYNHAPYIAQAIESVLNQQSNHIIKLIIGEDCSTDGTREIVQKYKAKYPQAIELILPDTNQGINKNSHAIMSRCDGDYIAFLEGDDYWLSARKIEKQVSILEKNKSLSGCAHTCRVINSQNEHLYSLPRASVKKPKFNLNDTITYGTLTHLSSMVYRNVYFPLIPKLYQEVDIIGEVILSVLHAQQGDIGFIDEEMSVYRLQSNKDAYSSKSTIDKHKLIASQWLKINDHLNGEFNHMLSDKASGRFFLIASEFLNLGNLEEAQYYYQKYKKYRTNYNHTSYSDEILFLKNLRRVQKAG